VFHETQAPLGLALLALFLVPFRRERGLVASLVVGSALVLAFAMHLEPVASLLVRLVPLLGAFRVPARAFIPLAAFVTLLGLGAVAASSTKAARVGLVPTLGSVALLLALAVVPGAAGEALGLLVVLGLVMLQRFVQRVPLPPWLLPAAIAVASICAFARLMPEPIREAAVVAHATRVRKRVEASAFRSDNELERVYVDDDWLGGPNALAAQGVPFSFGYWFPTRRSLELWAAAQGLPPYSAHHAFAPIDVQHPGTRGLAMLYDVRAWFSPDGTVVPLPTLGPVWFPRRATRALSLTHLGQLVRERATSPELMRLMRDDALVLPSDRLPTLEDDCSSATAIVARTSDGGQRIELDVTSPGRCLLVVSTNWTSRHRATLVIDSETRSPSLLPVYGSLLGVELPRGSGRLVLEPVLPPMPWAGPVRTLGALVLAVACAASARARSRATE
jgi:hypothetical protein